MDNVEKIFFTNKNYNLLLEVIYGHFQKEFDYSIDSSEEQLCLHVMQNVFSKFGSKPDDVRMMDHIKDLNKESLNRLIKIVTKRLHEAMVPEDNLDKLVPLISSQKDDMNELQPRREVFNKSNVNRLDTIYEENDVSNGLTEISRAFEDQLKSRNRDGFNLKLSKRTNINFEEKKEMDNSDINNIYEKELNDRNYNDIHNFDEEKKKILGFEKVQGQDQDIKGYDVGIPGTSGWSSTTGAGGDQIKFLSNPIDQSGTIITHDKADALKAMEGNEVISDGPTFFGGDKPKASGQDVLIPQPEKYVKIFKDYYKGYTKDYYVVIDSRDRNQDDWANPEDYHIDFDNVYKDVLTIELISAEVPKSAYLINTSNNKLFFQETAGQVSGGTFYTAEIPVGNYTATELRAAVETALEDPGASNYTVTVNTTLTNKFTIQSDLSGGATVFNLLFDGGTQKFENTTRKVYKEGSAGSVLGFNRTDLIGSGGAPSFTGQNQFNLNGENYIYLYIKELENLDGISSSSTATDTFTKITLDVDSNTNVKYYKSEHDYISKVMFTPPLAKLSQMVIKFYTYNGDLYDFNGLEHSLYFKVVTFNQSSQYFGQSANFPTNI